MMPWHAPARMKPDALIAELAAMATKGGREYRRLAGSEDLQNHRPRLDRGEIRSLLCITRP
jgi:hypothetical protein